MVSTTHTNGCDILAASISYPLDQTHYELTEKIIRAQGERPTCLRPMSHSYAKICICWEIFPSSAFFGCRAANVEQTDHSAQTLAKRQHHYWFFKQYKSPLHRRVGADCDNRNREYRTVQAKGYYSSRQ